MDPNQTLADIRELITDVNADDAAGDRDNEGSNLFALTELVTALDEWLSAGNNLPDEWDSAINRY